MDVRYIEVPLKFCYSLKTMSTINYWPRLRLNTCLDYVSVPGITKTSAQSNKTGCLLWNQAWDRIIITRSPGGVLDISLGGEVRRAPSYPDPV